MNKIGVLDFAVKINILSGEFEFDCLRCIILLRPLYTVREVAHVTFAGAHFFFFSPGRTYYMPPSLANFLNLCFGRAEHFEYRHLLYRGICYARSRGYR